MPSPLHVLVYGSLDAGPCDVYRFGMHVPSLARLGIEVRAMSGFRLGLPAPGDGSATAALPRADAPAVDWDAAFASDAAVLDRSEIDWADVIVFRRFYITRWSCDGCVFESPDRADLIRHRLATGHAFTQPDRLVGPLFTAFERYPELLRGRAIVYETDDDLLNVSAWNGASRRIAPERATIERMVRRADLVTVTTPVLAERHRRFNDEIRIVRNAIDPAWFAGADESGLPAEDRPAAEGLPALRGLNRAEGPRQGGPRLLYYGSPVRMRDYEVCRPAVDELVHRFPDARRVWLGALDAPSTAGSPEPVIAAVDEVGRFVARPEDFVRSLSAARPDIGLAPLVGDRFDAAKSELHWLEYTMAGAATVATRIAGGGPYDAIRDGVDGLLAARRGEWLDRLTRLASSQGLRDELVGRARERIAAEYTVDVRAAEWADAYRWAADHAGRAVAGRVHGLGALDRSALGTEAGASLAHRQRARAAAASAPDRLAALRGDRQVCWTAGDAVDPLVSVVIPVVDEPVELVSRAIASVTSGTYARIEVVLAVDERDARRMAALADADPRVRILTVPEPASVPAEARAARVAVTAHLLEAGIVAADGTWIAPLGPEAEFDVDHVATLLSVLVDYALEFAYGRASFELPSGERVELGSWPPHLDGVLTLGSELFSRHLATVVPFDPEAWRDGASAGWAFWQGVANAGARMASIETEVTRVRPLEPAGRSMGLPGSDRLGDADEVA